MSFKSAMASFNAVEDDACFEGAKAAALATRDATIAVFMVSDGSFG